jgi:hypothetical protein
MKLFTKRVLNSENKNYKTKKALIPLNEIIKAESNKNPE